MANRMVEFTVNVECEVEKVYLCGNTSKLGAWDANEAVELTKCEECGAYVKKMMMPEGEEVEFKVLASKDWNMVETGMWHEDLANHTFTVEKGLKVVVGVTNFGK